MKPTRAHLDALAARLHDQRARTIVERIVAHLDREKRSGHQGPDGYPAATMGAMGSGASSSVEAAVIVLVDSSDHLTDEHARRTWAAVRHLEAAVVEVDRCLANLDRLDALSAPERDPEGWCDNHARIGMAEPASDRYRNLCRPCGDYRAVNSVLPGRTAMVHRHEHGAWPPVVDRRKGARITIVTHSA